MEYDSRAPFLAHNLKLLEDTEYLQQKGRRVDLLGDENQLYAFFDARVPEGISTGAAFERWRREAEAKDPKLLWLTERDISPGDAELDAERFPDHLSAGPLVVQLRYRFEPGHEDDGVSALIPLHVLNQLPEEAFEWLVPGLLDEKIEALVRSLPKNLRVHFVPVPDAVARALPLLERGRGSLHAQLADALLRTGGVPVPRDAFREDLLPPHLRMNFVLLDDADKVIARSRSLAALREQACRRVPAGLCEAVAAHHRRADLGVRRSAGATGSRRRAGARQTRVSRRWSTRATASGCACSRRRPRRASAIERGSARLIRLVMARDLKPLRRDLAVNVQGEMVYRALAAHPLLESGARRRARSARRPARPHRDDGVPRGAASRCAAAPRSMRASRRSAAASGCRRRRSRASCRAALERLGRIQAALPKAAAPAAADIRAQLAWLVPAGFLLTTPWERLQEFPRYLQAIEQRLEKLGRDPRRDAQLAAEIAPLETRYRERVKAERGLKPPGEDEFRWLLEEFRVSLFAQQLKTRVPVSARRLEDAWVERERMPPG